MKKQFWRKMILYALALILTLLAPFQAGAASKTISTSQKEIITRLLEIYSIQHYYSDMNGYKSGILSEESNVNLCEMTLSFLFAGSSAMPQDTQKWMKGTTGADLDKEYFTKSQVERASKELFGVQPKKHGTSGGYELEYHSSTGKYSAIIYEGDGSFDVNLHSYKFLKNGDLSVTAFIITDLDSPWNNITAVFKPVKNAWGYTLHSVTYKECVDWATQYNYFLSEFSGYDIEYAVLDIGGDYLPELIIRDYEGYEAVVIGIKNDEMILVGEFDFTRPESACYYNKSLIETFSGSGTDTYVSYQRVNDKIVVNEYFLVAEEDDDTKEWSYYSNGKKVSEASYEKIEKAISKAPEIEWEKVR